MYQRWRWRICCRARTGGRTKQTRPVELNGLFAVATDRSDAPEGYARKLATLFQLDDEGLIERIYFVLASRKLALK